MADNKIDYRQMYPDRNRKSRTPEPAHKPKKKPDLGPFRPVREKTSEIPSRSYVDKSPRMIRHRIREMALDDPTLRSPEVRERVNRELGVNVSVILVSSMMTEFRATLRFLKDRGLLKRMPE